jgi:hypothetical protein
LVALANAGSVRVVPSPELPESVTGTPTNRVVESTSAESTMAPTMPSCVEGCEIVMVAVPPVVMCAVHTESALVPLRVSPPDGFVQTLPSESVTDEGAAAAPPASKDSRNMTATRFDVRVTPGRVYPEPLESSSQLPPAQTAQD